MTRREEQAMAGVNKVILIGNLGADPDVRYMQSGDAVASVNLATSETWKDRNSGERRERTEWHRVVFFGKIAEIVQQYLKKGAKVYVEGKLRTRKWQGQDGQDRYTTEVVVDMNGRMQMLSGRQDGAGSTNGTAQGQRSAPAGSQPQPQQGQMAMGEPLPFDDDIPF